MTDLAIETRGLRKEYRRLRGDPVVAVDGLDLEVRRGEVHGLLGPNGSGKTTTVRMLLGEPVPRRLPHVVGRVGALVDRPAFHSGLTARRNLGLLARAAGVPEQRVDEVLDQVGLGGHGADRVKGFSLGMRQRLGLAGALLKRPDVVLLDEPTLGLDPAGTREVRGLVRELARSGVAVLVGTHLLAEVQQVCDSVSILSAGRVRRSGSAAELVGRDQATGVRVALADLEGAAAVLRSAGLEVSRDTRTHLFVEGAADPSQVSRMLAEAGHYVRELIPERPDVESVLRRLTTQEAGNPWPEAAGDSR